MNTTYQTIEYNGSIPINILVTNTSKHHGHFHEDIQLVYVLKGKMLINIEDTPHLLGPKDIVVINSNEVHSIECDSSLATECMAIYFKPSFFEFLSIPIKSSRIICNSQMLQDDSLSTDCDKFDELRQELDLIVRKNKSHEKYEYIELVSSIFSILSIMFKNFPVVKDNCKNKLKEKDDTLARVSEIIQYLNRNYNEEISISDLATKYHISISHLCHIFKEVAGVSIGQHLTYIRLQKAKERLLLNQKDLITNIAMDCGFKNMGYFYSVFNRKMGCTPSQFRESYLNSKYDGVEYLQKYYNSSSIRKQKSSRCAI